jgi:hypothetical protein
LGLPWRTIENIRGIATDFKRTLKRFGPSRDDADVGVAGAILGAVGAVHNGDQWINLIPRENIETHPFDGSK